MIYKYQYILHDSTQGEQIRVVIYLDSATYGINKDDHITECINRVHETYSLDKDEIVAPMEEYITLEAFISDEICLVENTPILKKVEL